MAEHTHPGSGHPFPHPVTLVHTDADDRPLDIPGHGPNFHMRCADRRCLLPLKYNAAGKLVHAERPRFAHFAVRPKGPVVSDGELYGTKRGRYGR